MPISNVPTGTWPTGGSFNQYATSDAVLGGDKTKPANVPINELQEAVKFVYDRRNIAGSLAANSNHFIKFLKDAGISTTDCLAPAGTSLVDSNQIYFWQGGSKRVAPATSSAYDFSNADSVTHYYRMYVRQDGVSTYTFTEEDYGTSSANINDTPNSSYGAYLGYLTVAGTSGAGTGSFTMIDVKNAFPFDMQPTTVTLSTGTGSDYFSTNASFKGSKGMLDQAFNYTTSGGTIVLNLYALEVGSLNYNFVDATL